MDELAIAMKIWHHYNSIVKQDLNKLMDVLVNAYVKSPFLIEVKNYFLYQTMHQLTHYHIDKVLTSIEERFG